MYYLHTVLCGLPSSYLKAGRVIGPCGVQTLQSLDIALRGLRKNHSWSSAVLHMRVKTIQGKDILECWIKLHE